MRTRVFYQTAVSDDRAGSGSPLTAQAIMQSKTKIQKKIYLKETDVSICQTALQSRLQESNYDCKCRVRLFH